MNRNQKIHSLKVIKELTLNEFGTIVYIENIKGTDVYLTANRLEISKPIRKVFLKNPIFFQNVSKQFPPEDWIKIPY
jgi:hypothetical protein